MGKLVGNLVHSAHEWRGAMAVAVLLLDAALTVIIVAKVDTALPSSQGTLDRDRSRGPANRAKSGTMAKVSNRGAADVAAGSVTLPEARD